MVNVYVVNFIIIVGNNCDTHAAQFVGKMKINFELDYIFYLYEF